MFELSLNEEDGFKQIEQSFYKELEQIEICLCSVEQQLIHDNDDNLDTVLEINSGTGGTESMDFSFMLMQMYIKFGDKNKLKVSILDYQDGTVAGIKSCSLLFEGKNAYGLLKGENGVHRIQRVSPYNAQGKRQTSFASVFVTPQLDDKINIVINDNDCEIQAFRAGGKGGQNVNKVSSAIRLIHHPSGIVIVCRNERDQHQNKRIAFSMLKSKLYLLEKQKREESFNQKFCSSKTDTSFGHQIRTYSFDPDQYVKDERTKKMIYQINNVLSGDISPLISEYKDYLLREKLDLLKKQSIL